MWVRLSKDDQEEEQNKRGPMVTRVNGGHLKQTYSPVPPPACCDPDTGPSARPRGPSSSAVQGAGLRLLLLLDAAGS